MKRYYIAAVALLLLGLAACAYAQRSPESRATIFYLHNSWNTDAKAGEYDLKEGVFGLSATLSPSERFLFEIDGSLASADLDMSGSPASDDYSLSSLNDTRLAATVFSPAGITSLSLIANLPTGKTKLSDVEYTTTSLLTDNTRKFLVRRFGQGFDIGAHGAVHPKAGNLAFHLGAGYMLKGKFQAREDDTEKYKFGDEINGTAGFSLDQDKVTVGGSVNVIYYMKDKVGDAEVFQAGVATIIQGSIAYTDILNLYTGVGVVMRGKGKVQGSSTTELVDEPSRSGRNEFIWYAGAGYPVGDKLRINGRIEYLSLSDNDYGTSSALYRPKSSYFGFGGGCSFAFTETFYASAMATLYSGAVKLSDVATVGEDADLSGLGLLFALTYRVK